MHKNEGPGALHISGGGELRLFDTTRFQRVCTELPRPSSQFPRLIHFVGRRQKNLALKYVLPHNNISRASTPYFAGLRADTSTLNHDSPLLFLDSDPFISIGVHQTISESHHAQSYPLAWLEDTSDFSTVSSILHARLLFLFANVICVFIDDFPDSDSLVQQLKTWVNIGPGSNFERAIRPRLLLVSSHKSIPALEAKLLGHNRDRLVELTESFSTIQLFFLGGEQLSILAQFHQLREAILSQSTEMFYLRKERYLLFSAVHLQEFFRAATAHISKSISVPFDFLSTARPLTDSHRHMSQHLVRFFQLCQKNCVPFSDIVSVISSALLMDAFPPGMHIFDPSWMFRERYERICSIAFQETGPEPTGIYCSSIKAAFIRLTHNLQEGKSSLELRTSASKNCLSRWSQIMSNLTCLFCLIHEPESPVLPCGHAICENCILRLGRGVSNLEFHFFLDRCYICEAIADTTIKVRPPTAGIRILCIDGGGTRGVIPLESLTILQELLGPIPIKDCFELAIGTSSGGLIQLGLFALLMDLATFSNKFDGICQKVFGGFRQRMTWASSFKRIVRCWVADGVHDPEVFETDLKAIAGPDTRLFGTPKGIVAGYKCAVVTSSIADATPILLTNYNGTKPISSSNGYELLRPENCEDEPRIWEAARATSAAPFLFRTARIGELGDYQDGGLKHNNPCLLAQWESRRLWPNIKAPDLFLSLGTGNPVDLTNSKNGRFRHFLLDGFIPRLWRSCMAKSDGDVMWAQMINSIDENSRGSYYRVNIPLSGSMHISNVEGMPALRQSVRRDVKISVTLLTVAKAALASSFYFQLDCHPFLTESGYLVQGSIRCRYDVRQILCAMAALGLRSFEYDTESEKLCNLSDPWTDVCDECQRYRKNVHFYVSHLSEEICIFMRSTAMTQQRLSGFPETVSGFIQKQNMNAVFGNEYHGVPGIFQCTSCSVGCNLSGIRPKRRRSPYSPPLSKKKIRRPETIAESDRECDY